MLTTNLRTTQTLDPTGVARPAVAACVRPAPRGEATVTATAYQVSALQIAATPTAGRNRSASFDARTAGFAITGAAWSFIGTKPMPTVDLHPDRWPLQSTS